MPHYRQLIRDEIVENLTGLATTGANVKATRLSNYTDNELPAITVYTLNETSDILTMGLYSDRILRRELDVAVEITHTGQAGDDALDNIAAEIEQALDDPKLNAYAKNMILTATEISFDDSSETIKSKMRMSYRITYDTKPTNPTSAA